MSDAPQPSIPTAAAWALRIGVMMDFLGHGMVGFGLPAPWASYFGVVGIGRNAAFELMPWVALLDLSMAVLALVYPIRIFVLFMVAWTVWTAALRPLAGEPFWEAVERAGNFGAPLGLLLILDGKARWAWFRGRLAGSLTNSRQSALEWGLRLSTVALLFGHGALGLIVRKPLLAAHYSSLGLEGSLVEPWIGAFEICLAIVVLLHPSFRILVFVLVWKLATELLNPIAGSAFWVFVEHGGSYAAPLALALLRESTAQSARNKTSRENVTVGSGPIVAE